MTNANEIKAKMVAKLSTMGVIELSNMLVELNRNLSDEASTIVEIGLEVIETKMSESDFIDFCETLAA